MVRSMTLVGVFLAVAAYAATVALKPYPGAKVDEQASKTATSMLIGFGEKGSKLKATVYMTSDSFEKVTAYYLAKGKETRVPPNKPEEYTKLPSGEPIKEMYVIFDGAADIVAANAWAKIQRPFVGAIGTVNGRVVVDDVRDVTVVTVVQEK